ncbi:MAG: hypothetical protein LJE64_13420 [Desulfofustis sp.]|jgi:hypothetical protein|nr:hypothetical protein [Desulfofustis sp.]
MKHASSSTEAGRQDAEQLIRSEQIDYDPFIAMSDMHLVRKTIPVRFEALVQNLAELDPALCENVKSLAGQRAAELGADFSPDRYAEGIAEGVAAVWDKIRDQVLGK